MSVAETTGYIKLHRRLLDAPKSNDPEFMWVWVTLLLLATHKPRQVDWCGKTITLQPGQLITGYPALAERTGVSETKVRRILERFKTDRQIDRQAGNLSSLVTIRNWAEYQTDDSPVDRQMTDKRQTNDRQLTANKNERIIYPPETTSPTPTGGVGESPVSEFVSYVKTNWPDVKNPVALEIAEREAYPGLDLLHEARAAQAWCVANPRRAPKDHQRFFHGWLQRSYEAWRKSPPTRALFPPLSSSVPPKKGRVFQIGDET